MQLSIWLTGPELVMPLANQHTLQGAIYALIRAGDSELAENLHNTEDNQRNYKGFTFAPLRGGYRVEGRTIRFLHGVRMDIRCISRLVMEAIVLGASQQGFIRFGNTVMKIADIRMTDRHITQDHICIRQLSPVVVHRTGDDKKTIYFSPEDDSFYEGIVTNAYRKYEQIIGHPPERPLTIQLSEGCTPRRVFTVYKSSYITAWSGSFELRGSADMLDLLYQTGLGEKNAQGFGMF